MKNDFGRFLQETHNDIYGAGVHALTFDERTKNPIRIEWALDGDTLKIHLFRTDTSKWSLDYAKSLHALWDELAPGEEANIGYEDIVDSWFILSDGYGQGKIDPDIASKHLCQQLLDRLTS